MIKKILFIFILQSFMLGFAQNLKPIAQKISEYHFQNKSFEKYDLFKIDKSSKAIEGYKKTATDITVFALNSSELQNIIKNKPELIEISFPFQGDKNITIELYKNQIFTNDFKVTTNKGEVVNYTPGVYYKGIVKGENNSVVAFSFFENDIVGVASTPELGNIVLGKAKNSEDFVSYSDSKLIGKNPFVCGVDELKENQNNKISFDPKQTEKKTLTDNCVRVYYEVCYKPYQNNGSNTTTTVNWLTAIHNNVATLYLNDDIKIALSEVYVWTSPDPYTAGANANLAVFRNSRPIFNGDLAHLINAPASSGVAYLNSLCTDSKYAFSPVTQNYDAIPVYSWTINVVAHEMGHSLGSPHTHACAWNGNNTAIDGCGLQSGSQGSVCPGPIPNGGTIMSYCHLVSGSGINFSNGFGPQPSALIRSIINSRACLGNNCTTSCDETIIDLSVTEITQNSANVFIIDGSSLSWKYKLSKMDGTIVQMGIINSQTFSLNNLEPATYYNIYIGTDCSSSSAYQKYRTILTDGNWCSGIQFTDSGGVSGTYSNNEILTKTFYPLSNSKLRLVFTEFNLEGFNDYMYVYNGPVGSPLFSNGNDLTGNLIPGPFISTHPTGAITVEFFSNGSGINNGWKANFTCSFLGVEDTAIRDNIIDIYPNPAKTMIIVSSKEGLKSYKMYDEAGRLVTSASSLRGNKTEINLSSMQTGNYVISIETENQTINKKLIKQ